MSTDHTSTRRKFLAATALAVGGLGLPAVHPGRAAAQPNRAPTPACSEGGPLTQRQTEGPYFKPRSPARSDLREPGMAGRPVELSGLVLTRACRPVVGALVELWQADDQGDYDNAGFRLRGHVFADPEGRYLFRTIVPGVYPGRTRHFHVKVQAPGRAVLTTQFYFPGERDNRRDPLYRPDLLMRVAQAADGLAANFDVVLDLQ